MPRIVALIPARGGSKGIPKKNIVTVAGKPLIWHSIQHALQSRHIEDVYVSTDDAEIAMIAVNSGAKVINRPAEMSTDTAKTSHATKHAFENIFPIVDFVVLLQPTVPLRTAATLDNSITAFLEYENDFDSLMTVKTNPYKLGRIIAGCYVKNKGGEKRRQDLEKEYFETGNIYIYKAEHLATDNIYGQRILPFVVESEKEALDIDTYEDLEIIESILGGKKMEMKIGNRLIGKDQPAFVIAEVGINHDGSMEKAKMMIDAAKRAGADAVKFQLHIVQDEMVPEAKKVIPGHTTESIYDIIEGVALSVEQHHELKRYCEEKGIMYFCTPFSRAAANELEKMNVPAYKIGSGECNNYPLIEHVASFGKPMIVSTGMNDIAQIQPTVDILRQKGVPFVLLHCTSLYPTPYEKVRLNGIKDLQQAFQCDVGLSDHSVGNYTCLAAIMLDAVVMEKHFTCDKTWPGPDISVSIDEREMKELVVGCEAIRLAKGGSKDILPEEQPTIDFAYASVVTIKPITAGEQFSMENLWVKRPGTGEFIAKDFKGLLGKTAAADVAVDEYLKKTDVA